MSITGFVGNPRQGKTQGMIMTNYLDYLKGRTVYSYKLKPTSYRFPFKVINVNDILSFDMPPGNLMLDEVHTLIDSRNPTQLSRLLSYFWTQSGKRDVKLSYTAQLESMVDLRLREIAGVVFKTQKVYSINRVQHKKRIKGFRYYKVEGEEYKNPKFVPIEKAKHYFDLYNTYQVIMPLELDATDSINMKWIEDKFKDCPNKRTFQSLVRGKYNFIGYDDVGSVYDCLKNNMRKDALDILKIK
jgi:hypothetical protein